MAADTKVASHAGTDVNDQSNPYVNVAADPTPTNQAMNAPGRQFLAPIAMRTFRGI
ncbi:MAG: hypothetical protein GXP15_12345 [Gammaproteobacteria bacterium]|nr:hypothetical protein [Gammaproteobacteria bacterium]